MTHPPTSRSRNRSRSRVALGAYGERVAARHLQEHGMQVLDRNWRCPEGEIDLVLRDGATLVICEVKTRTSTSHGSPHEAVTDAKLERLLRLSQRWLAARPPSGPPRNDRPGHWSGLAQAPVRVDVVAVLRPRRGPAVVEHVRGVGR